MEINGSEDDEDVRNGRYLGWILGKMGLYKKYGKTDLKGN